ncbi:MAG TPA: TDT family transporter [Pseudonocardiaceae bacterium]|jgi:C4-dicarboxylate transporter/malic acid transport protein|nr:TDT family transporter [Pseudonocardiaceae bacterium]
MTTLMTPPNPTPPIPPAREEHALARWGLLRDLREPRQILGTVGPNWYASIMGTGIVANAAATLPLRFPGLRDAATVVWTLAAVLLVGLTAVWLLQWIRRPGTPSRHAADPVVAQFYGAPPMALLTVGAGALLLGHSILGTGPALVVDWTLWIAGTIGGLASSVIVPYLMFTRHRLSADSVFGGWLMPIVPPMVSAATGALLVPYAPAGQLRLSLLLGCYALFGLSLICSLVVITLLWWKLTQHKTGTANMVPTLWIVLGPLGQSITAANLLGGVAHLALPAPYATGMEVFGLVYGLPVWGFALLWVALAGALTVHTARKRLPFSLTWWSFTFPVGTLVTGTSGLAARSHADVFVWAACLCYLGLVLAWAVVAVRTGRDSVRGRLFVPLARSV